ncbi:VOC family protein [Labrys wisconsinensis]|uniref:Enzyme related to lactoylglutathione lyase n=1 Tax=Labrys wisconsinensis TaxID=425677 RepID=A0ABU0J505_9HYPH|nr:VOC family protein [Labrys wisconsinensis]MDQ0468359.1 putative enzyme related to lactoylglutathione lyase [Labrys wisconsinensis]
MTVKRLQNSYHVVGDVAHTRAFYETALGLPVKFADGERWVQFDAGANFAIAAPEEAPAGVRGAVVVFEVDALPALCERIEAAGGRILGRRDMGEHGRTVTAADPEGTVFQLFERART